MSKSLYFSAKSISMSKKADRKPQSLLTAARHNLREQQLESGARENIALALSHLNVVLHGPSQADAVQAIAKYLKDKYAVPKRKLRKDHVQALEFVVSLRVDSGIDEMGYFKANLRWLIEVFGVEVLLSAVVHFDESAPHMHALVLPIIDGKYQGGTPIDKSHLRLLIKRFADEVGALYGLKFEPVPKLHAAQRQAASNLVIDHLESIDDPVVDSRIWSGVEKHIKQTPVDFLQLLGLQLPDMRSKTDKTMAEIFTGTGKKTSEDRERLRNHNLSCVGQRIPTAPVVRQERGHEAA